MEENKTLSEKLEEQYFNLRNTAIEEIVKILKKNKVTEVDLTRDEFGNSSDNYLDYDEEWVIDNRIFVDCCGRYGWEKNCYVSSIKLSKTNKILFIAEGEDTTYEDSNVDCSVYSYIDILKRLEYMDKNYIFREIKLWKS